MVIGLGVDIVEIGRIEKAMRRSRGRFKDRYFSEEEIRICERRKREYECFAARFAAKEAFVKAVGKGFRDSVNLKNIVVLKDSLGRASLKIRGAARMDLEKMGGKHIHLAMVHSQNYAVAVVVIEG